MKKLVYPIIVFVTLQLAVLTAITLWIIWYVLKKKEYEGVANLARSAYSSIEINRVGYASMIGGLALLLVILVGATYLFIGWIKERLIHRQRATFFSGFTHELMTPLTCIQMNLETMMAFDLEKSKRDQLMFAAFSEGKRLQRTIYNILEMTRLEHKKKTVQLEKIEAKKYFEEMKEHFLQNNSPLKIEVECPEDYFIGIDKKAFELVLSNLIENTLKYSQSEEVSWKGVIQKNEFCFFYSDKGFIKPINEKKVFNIFYQENGKQKGFGLGLYIVKSLISLHKGKISIVHSERGSSFKITLPLVKK